MATYIRLTDYKSSDEKEEGFFKPENRYEAKQEDFEKIPGSPVAYWVSDRVKDIFEESENLGNTSEIRQCLITGDDDRFIRIWSEVDFDTIGLHLFQNNGQFELNKWFHFNKGGEYKRWYGNFDYIVNWENDGYEIKHNFNDKGKIRSRPQNLKYYFREAITW